MTSIPNRQHIVTAYDRELTRLRGLVLDMGERAVEQTRMACLALLAGDSAAARKVLAGEPPIDNLNLLADEEIFQLIARRQPTAIDLRLVLAFSKVVGDLERAGDKAERIARAVIRLLDADPGPLPESLAIGLREIDMIVRGMLERSIDGLATADMDKAISVFESELQLYRCVENLRQTLVALGDELHARRLAELIGIGHALERLGNHGANIAEQIVYVVRGNDVRYRNRELLIDALRHPAPA